MANDLSAIMPKILARGLMVLRERCIMPRLVNSDYSADAAKKGDTIDVPRSAAVSTVAVAPAITPIAAVDHDPTSVQVSLDQWYQNYPIHLTDKELTEIDKNIQYIPLQLEEAIKSLANRVNQAIHGCYKGTDQGVFGWYGTAGTTPFGTGVTVQSAVQARKVLNQQLCPREGRAGVLNFDAEASALALSEFSDAEKVGSADVKLYGEIGLKYGILWTADDHVLTHTAGTIVDGNGARTCAVDNGAGYAIGIDTINVDEGAATSATGTIVLGDIISFAGHTQTYCVVANTGSAMYADGAYTFATNNITGLKFYPALKAAVVDNEVCTVKATHVVNLVFHRDAFAFATRPLVLSTQDMALGSKILSMTDPKTGLSLRLEISRQHKQVAWEFDILWGNKLVMPELCMRLAG